MDNFDFKNYLQENKLTYQEKMKQKAGKKNSLKEGKDEDKIAKYEKYTYTLDGKKVKPEISFIDHLLHAELDGEIYKIETPDENGNIELKKHKGKTGMYTEDFKENTSTKEKAHQAPKDKSKQGPSTLNEGKIFFGGY